MTGFFNDSIIDLSNRFFKPDKEKSSRMDYCTESPVLLRRVNKKCDEDGLRWDKSIFRLIRELPL